MNESFLLSSSRQSARPLTGRLLVRGQQGERSKRGLVGELESPPPRQGGGRRFHAPQDRRCRLGQRDEPVSLVSRGFEAGRAPQRRWQSRNAAGCKPVASAPVVRIHPRARELLWSRG